MESLRVGVLEEDEVFRHGLVAVLSEEGFACIVLGGVREMSSEAAEADGRIDVAIVCSRSLGEMRLTCPVVLLATEELAGQGAGQALSTVMATLPHERLSGEQLVASVRAAAAGLQVKVASFSHRHDQVLDPRSIEVLRLLTTGADTRAMARHLGSSERTVKTLVHDIHLMLGTTTRAQAAAEGVRLGLI